MSPAFQTLVPLLALFVSQSLCFQFTFPIPGKIDYRFAAGDVALVEWTPNENISQLALNCGPDLGIDSDTPAYTVVNSELSSGSPYKIPDTWTESNNKYCMFCTGTFNKACSGIFLLEEPSKDSSPMIHALNGSTAQAQNTIPSSTLAPSTQTSTTAIIVAPGAGLVVTNTETSQGEGPKTGSEASGTSCTTQLTASAPGQQISSTITTTAVAPSITTINGTGGTPSGCPFATGASSCIPVNPSSTLLPSFNFPSVTEPSATLLPDSGVSSSRELKSTLAGVVAIGVLAFVSF